MQSRVNNFMTLTSNYYNVPAFNMQVSKTLIMSPPGQAAKVYRQFVHFQSHWKIPLRYHPPISVLTFVVHQPLQ